MANENHNSLWRDFPKTALEFEERFRTEEDCRDYWIEVRWGGKPACARCASTRVWTERGGFLFECAACGHQTSLTSGTLLERTRKPFKMWFRAIFEISTRRTGISGKDSLRVKRKVAAWDDDFLASLIGRKKRSPAFPCGVRATHLTVHFRSSFFLGRTNQLPW